MSAILIVSFAVSAMVQIFVGSYAMAGVDMLTAFAIFIIVLLEQK